MAERGYIEDENISYITYYIDQLEEVEPTAQSLVDANVDLILALGRPHALAAKKVTEGTEASVVFGICGDPVSVGLVDSMEQPGGNITGVSCTVGTASEEKRLELLTEVSPDLNRVFIAYDPNDPGLVAVYNAVIQAASRLDLELVTQEQTSAEEYSELLANLPGDIDAYFILNDPVSFTVISDILALSVERRFVVSSPLHNITQSGAFMSYGPDFFLVGKQVSRMADQVLNGADAGTLPVESGELLLAVNLQTAEAIGVEVPEAVLEQADIIYGVDEQ
jgi:putative ABC transport system substrate-binding protein